MLVDHRHRGRLGDLGDGERRRLELLGAEPVPGHVDHVVDAAEDPEVAVGRLHGPVASEVGPVAPVRAVLVRAVLRVVGLYEPVGLRPRWSGRCPATGCGCRCCRPCRCRASTTVAVLVVDHRVDAEHPRAAAARLHRLQSAGSVLPRNPPFSVCHQVSTMAASPFADHVVVPAPHVRLDRLADRGHVLEVVVVLLAAPPGRTCAASGWSSARCGRCSPRGCSAIRHGPAARRDSCGTPSYMTLVVPSAQRAVDDVGVTGDPADVRDAPVGVARVDVLVVLRRAGDIGEVAAGAVLAALRAAGRAAACTSGTAALQPASTPDPRRGRGSRPAARRRRNRGPRPSGSADAYWPGGARQTSTLSTAAPCSGCRRDRLVGLGLVVDQLAVAVVAVHRDQDAAAGVGDTSTARGAAESAEHLGVNDAETGAGQHGHRQLRHHRQVEGHPVADSHASRTREAAPRTRSPGVVELLIA